MDGAILKVATQNLMEEAKKLRALTGKGDCLLKKGFPVVELIDGGAVEPISFINQPIHPSQKQVKGLTCSAVKTMIVMALIQHTIEDYGEDVCTFVWDLWGKGRNNKHVLCRVLEAPDTCSQANSVTSTNLCRKKRP